MRVFLTLLCASILCVLAAPALAAEVPIPPAPTQWVTDTAGALSTSTRAALNQRLATYAKTTGHQVIVWIGSTTGDTPLEDWTIRAFTAWKPGRKGLDDGAALFLFMRDRKLRIEVGYGLEDKLTDAVAAEIIRNDIVPRLKAGDADGAVTAGVNGMLAAIEGEQGAQPQTRSPSGNGNPYSGLFVLVFILVWFGLIMVLGRLHRNRRGAWVIGPGGGFGGWSGGGWSGGGGGGGFSGGGGGGGGGGASGGW
jgi:uncharacterized protein